MEKAVDEFVSVQLSQLDADDQRKLLRELVTQIFLNNEHSDIASLFDQDCMVDALLGALKGFGVRAPLLCELNNSDIENAIVSESFDNVEIQQHLEKCRAVGWDDEMSTFFEHGQWFVECKSSGRQWSVTDSDYGFDFEEVSHGDMED